ncbi:MAG: ribosome small subunit-dependent GTPase A [Bacilli bacterium]|jgi:ribosome biogenesis GTPase|nr:ribosome small subunit-dependent GTPase A [Bacilli bacterium]
MKTGKIIRIISNLYTVNIENQNINCQARGKFRQNKITPLVGDYCEVDIENKYIMRILPRTNYLLRPSIANVDIALIITSLKKPDFSPYLLDKLLTLVSLNHIKPMICFTKIDLLKEEEQAKWQELKRDYERAGYMVHTNQDLSMLRSALKNQVVVVTGQTGAGKSTLLNSLNPHLTLKTSPISEALNRGVHTTRHTEIYHVDDFFIADTPGFSALDLKGYQKEEIRNAFKEFQKYHCKYSDCNHLEEPDCGVKEALAIGEIRQSRYESYRQLLKEGE